MLMVRAPLRVSFGGGGTDLAAYYARFGGFVLSAAIAIGFASVIPGHAVADLIQYESLDLAVASSDLVVRGEITEIVTKMDGDKVSGFDAKLKDGTTVHLWRVENGVLLIDRVDIGSRCFLGVHSALGLGARMGDDTRLDDQSLLPDAH